jgi:hypothetical protein
VKLVKLVKLVKFVKFVNCELHGKLGMYTGSVNTDIWLLSSARPPGQAGEARQKAKSAIRVSAVLKGKTHLAYLAYLTVLTTPRARCHLHL